MIVRGGEVLDQQACRGVTKGLAARNKPLRVAHVQY